MKNKIKYGILVILLAFILPSMVVNKKAKSVSAYTQNDIVFYGNDISYWQGEVVFNKMKSISNFVIIRIGYGTKLDKKFTTYMDNAIKVGLNVGVYIYSLAETEQEAINEANWVVSTLVSYGYDSGKLTFPIYFDYEENYIITSKTRQENTAIINAFATTIFNAGFYAGVYMGASHFNSYVNADNLICDVWLAQYFGSNNPSDFSKKLNNSHKKVKMWQFAAGAYTYNGKQVTSHIKYTGKECGVSSESIDENWCFVDYPTIIKQGGYNGFVKQNASQNSSSSSKSEPISSSNSQNASNNVVNGSQNSTIENSGNIVTENVNKPLQNGCNGSIASVKYFVILGIIASIVIVFKKL